MAVTPSALLEPTGELAKADFPGMDDDAIEAQLQAFIDDGAARVAGKPLTEAQKDSAVTAWSYARANRMILRRLSRTPASFSLTNEGSQTMLSEQIRTFKSEAQRWETQYETIVGDEPTPDDVPSAPATNSYVW